MTIKNTILFLVCGFVSLGSFFGSALRAEPTESKEPCLPHSYQELVRCAVMQSAEIQLAEQQLKTASNLEGIARQGINPELDLESVRKSSDQSETTVSLLFDVRLGGKRDAALNEARAEIEKTKAQRDLNSSQTKLDLILKLYRLYHLKGEIKIEEESVSTFAKIVNQFQAKAALSPEQEVSLSIFRMAATDHQLSLTKLRNEEGKIIQEVISSTGLSTQIVQENLPSRRTLWPEISLDQQADSSPYVRFAQGDLMVAKSQREKANAEAWPDFKIGPAIKVQNDGGTTENFFGLSLSTPLPIFNLNASGRAYSGQKVVEAEMSLSLANRRIAATRAQLIKTYQGIVATLKSSLSAKVVAEKHEQIERLFFRGLVPSSIVIEAHRQLIDLEKNKNESERDAIEALGSVYIIDNQFSEVIL